jgi:MFS family permease
MNIQLFIAFSVLTGLVIAIMNVIIVFYIAPSVKEYKLLRVIVGIPSALVPISTGFWLSSVAFVRFQPTTDNERGWFLGIWLGIALISFWTSVVYYSVKEAKSIKKEEEA